MTDRPTHSHMFESASKIIISGGSFIGSQNNAGAVDDKTDRDPTIVYNNVSWNAILNSGGRADTVRCYPGTREAVMAQIENWISAADQTGQPIFWLSGPAGAGKSAIAQSIAERCLARGIPMANFFFFRADSTRNHAAPLVATLLCQLFDICPVIKRRIHDFITQNFYIFDTSVEQQLKTLMLTALMHPGQGWTGRQKIVLILDGLDECSSDNNSHASQREILCALHNIVVQKDSPFILLVSSRADPHLTMSFNGIHSHVARLYLDGDSFSSLNDVKRFVLGEFNKIKETHHLSWTLDADWPSTADIESIVRKSSGHFIYAATVMRFLQTSPESPVLSLEKVEGIRPVENDSPFAQLDAIYSHILAMAKNWPKTSDILATQILPDAADTFWRLSDAAHPKPTPLSLHSYTLSSLGYSLQEVVSYTANLTALMKVEYGEVKFYHTSISDFLLDKRRSGEFFIDLDEFRLKLVPPLIQSLGGVMDNLNWPLLIEHFTSIKTTSDALTEALSNSRLFSSGMMINGATARVFLVKVRELYFEANAVIYNSILERWLTWFHKNNIILQEEHLDGIQHATDVWNQLTRTVSASSEATKQENSAEDHVVLPANGSSPLSVAENAISEMLMRLVQPVKRESGTDFLPEEGIVAAIERFCGPLLDLTEVNSTEIQENRMDPNYVQQQLSQRTQLILQDLEAWKSGDTGTVRKFHERQAHIFREPETQRCQRQTLLLYQEDRLAQAMRRQGELDRRDEELMRREEELMRKIEKQRLDVRKLRTELRMRKELQLEREQEWPKRRQEELRHREDDRLEVREQQDDIQLRHSVHAPSPPDPRQILNVVDNPPHAEAASLLIQEDDAFSESQVLQDLFTQTISFASTQELLAIRGEAEAAVAEVASVRASVFTARVDLEAAFNEARSVRADSKREFIIARNDVVEAQAKVLRACAERDAVYAEVQTAREEAATLTQQIHSAQEQPRSILEDKSKANVTSSRRSLPNWLFF